MNRTAVVWFVLTQFMVYCLLLCVFRVAVDVYPTSKLKPHTGARVYKNLYIDRNIDTFHSLEIELAANRWNRITNHMAEFHVIPLPVPDMDTVREDPDGIVVTVVSEDHPDVIALDKDNKHGTLAFCNLRAHIPILAYVDGRVTDDVFEKVTLHELGHAMGLEHSKEDESGENQIMYPNTLWMSDEITDADLQQFCSIYHCDASKLRAEPRDLKHEKEPLHL